MCLVVQSGSIRHEEYQSVAMVSQSQSRVCVRCKGAAFCTVSVGAFMSSSHFWLALIGAFAGISTENVLLVRIKGMKETNVCGLTSSLPCGVFIHARHNFNL